MSAAAAPQIAVCREYQRLLEECQKALVHWQQRRTMIERSALADKRAAGELKRLQANYANVYMLLENHERTCQTCQYIAKIAGLDFESMASALDHNRQFS